MVDFILEIQEILNFRYFSYFFDFKYLKTAEDQKRRP